MRFPAFTPAQFSLTGRPGLRCLALVVLAFAAGVPLLLLAPADLAWADRAFRLVALALGGIRRRAAVAAGRHRPPPPGGGAPDAARHRRPRDG